MARHISLLSGCENPRWHIDYILPHCEFVGAVMSLLPRDMECVVATSLSKFMDSVQGFGCSDCSCVSHLHYSTNDVKDVLSRIV